MKAGHGRAVHMATVGGLAGLLNYLEAGAHGNPLLSVLVGAIVAGLSGGAGAVIRRRSGAFEEDRERAPLWALPDVAELLSRLGRVENQVHDLANLVTTLLGELELERLTKAKGDKP